MQSLLILGRQPSIGLVELESLYGADKVRPVNNQAALVDIDPCQLKFDRLGGSIKFCKVLSRQATIDWQKIENFLIKVSPTHSQAMPEGKMQLGLSSYGYNVGFKDVAKTAIRLKQVIRKTGRSVRVIPNNEPALNSAQVIHNRLTQSHGWELVIIKDGASTIIAQTVKVQDINAYTLRDRNRPYRDAKVGMLPPKLAQILINLATGLLPSETSQSICAIEPNTPAGKHYKNDLLLDPFCGTGVILQEAAIMGYACTGTDIDPRMVSYAKDNLSWLKQLAKSPLSDDIKISLEVGDATNHNWRHFKPTFIASEVYLGRPLSKPPAANILTPIREECDQIIHNFLTNLSTQIEPGTRICLAVPAWQLPSGSFAHLSILDSLEVIGYNRISFKHSGNNELIYYRPNQVVARQLLVLVKK